jgi:thiol-disulfide isomerase/thioredoxin
VRSELGAALIAFGVLAACDEKPSGPAPERFAAVKKSARQTGGTFCEKQYPGTGAGTRAYLPAALRAFGDPAEKAAAATGWKWINVWATWCKPCVEEMGLLTRWRDALGRDGVSISFELLSIDDTADQGALEQWRAKNLPGPIRWVRGDDEFKAFADGLGIDRGSAIPIHALVDPSGKVRCVRVGAIHEQDYGAVRDLLAGG